MKRQVLQIVGDPSGGIRKHIHDIFWGLHQEFSFHYITSADGDAQFKKDLPLLLDVGVQFRALKIVKRPSLTDFYNIIIIYKYIKQYNISLVHGHGAKGGLYARIAGKLAGCKVIYTPHGGVVHNMFGRIESRIYLAVEKFLCLFTDLLIFESHYTENSFNAKFGCCKVKKVVNYNGVSIPQDVVLKTINHKADSVRKIGVFGIMRHEKGQDIAYEAIRTLLQQGVKVELHFFGEGPLKDVLMKQAEQDGIVDDVFFHGYVTDVYVHMLKMDCILIPSRFESFGYVAIEASLACKFVICSRTGGLVEILDEHSCLFFDVEEEGGLAYKIQEALLMPSEQSLIIINKAQQRVVSFFSLNKMISNVSKIYDGIINDCFE